MSKLVVHAKIMIDGVSDTPKKDQLISIEDGKIVSIEEYHETNEASTSRNFYTSIQKKKHPVVLSQRVFFMIHSMLVLFY